MHLDYVLMYGGSIAATFFFLFYSGKHIKVAKWKQVIIHLLGVMAAFIGSILMFWLEKGGSFSISGRSFFGGHFFAPVGLVISTLIFRLKKEERWDILDIQAPLINIGYAVFKIGCYRSGCCGGRKLWTNADGTEVRFPSQLVDMISGVVIAAVLFYMIRTGKFRGTVYYWYHIIYGTSRFILNWFRSDLKPFVGPFPPGNFWGLVAIVWGFLLLYIHHLRENGVQERAAARNGPRHHKHSR